MNKVLIIEDSNNCSLIIEAYLQRLKDVKFDVYSAKNGREALNLIDDQDDFDIIFLDLKMPIMNGYEFVENYQGKAKIIVTTALLQVETRGNKNLFDSILLKPIPFDHFKKTIESISDFPQTLY